MIIGDLVLSADTAAESFGSTLLQSPKVMVFEKAGKHSGGRSSTLIAKRKRVLKQYLAKKKGTPSNLVKALRKRGTYRGYKLDDQSMPSEKQVSQCRKDNKTSSCRSEPARSPAELDLYLAS